jgi:hypothetical protein
VRAGQSAPVDGRVGRALRRAWVVSPRHDKTKSFKGVCTLEPSADGPSRIAGDRTVTLAMPFKALSPSWGKSVGGVSGRAGAKAGGSNLSATIRIPSRDVMVEGILVFWKAALFAGRRRNEGLGRSVQRSGYLPEARGAPMTADVRRTPRRGTPSACANKRMHPSQAREIVACAQGTRPSLGPSTRAR